LEAFGACLASAKIGDIVVLVDESGSLQQTDPKNSRVIAARYLLERFADVADRRGYDIEVLPATFSAQFAPLQGPGWTKATRTQLPTLNREIDELATRNVGLDTDYWTALTGARRALAERRAVREAANATTCQALIMVTDGDLSIQPRRSSTERKPYAPDSPLDTAAGVAQAMERARTSLCRVGGLADQVRDQGVVTLAVGLEQRPGAQNFTLIESVATGGARGKAPCGRPPATPVGDFYRAAGLGALIDIFDRIGETQTPLVQGTGVCFRTTGNQCLHSFVLDASVRTVHILAHSLESPTLALHLQPPGRAAPVVVAYSAGGGTATVSAGSVSIKQRWLGLGQATLDVDRPSNGTWSGLWRLWFVETQSRPPAGVTARSQIQISSDLQPALLMREGLKLRSGEVAKGLQLGISRASDGSVVSPSELLGTATLDVSFTGPDGRAVPIVTGADATMPLPPVDLDLTSVSAGSGTLAMRLAVTTQSLPEVGGRPAVPGTELGPANVTIPLTIAPPVNYPHVRATRVDFGSGEGVTTLKAGLDVAGPGCLWVGAAEVRTLPDSVASVTVAADSAASAATCLKVTEGQQAMLPLTMTLSGSGNGVASGMLTVSMQPRDGGATVTKQVTFTGEVFRPVNVERRLMVFLLTLLVGLGLPLAVAQLARWFGAKIPNAPLLAYVVPVTVDGDVLRGGLPLTLDPREASSVNVPAGGARVLDVAGVRLRTLVDLDIRRAGYTLVDGGGTPTVTGREVTRVKGVPSARLPLTVHNSWFATVGTDERPGVVLVVLTAASATSETRRALLDEVRDRLPRLVAELGLDPGQPATAAAADGGFWSGKVGEPPRGTAQPTARPGAGSPSAGNSAEDWWGS
jgi:hypothetical protein